MTARLDGKVAIVTGAARGMGAAESRRLHADGATVVLTDVLDDDGKALADELGERARYVHLDVVSEEQWAAVVDEVERDLGRLDVLVNNAGILRFAAIEECTLEEFRLVIDINLTGTFLGMRAAIPAMRRAGGGSIVNLSSTEGLGATVFCGAYTASKFGVRGITKVAAIEYGREGIRVNSVHPGGDDNGRKYVANKVALKRMGQADDVAALVAFLASEESSYCTGAEFVIDGGATATAGF
jgi:3alpha(or 20beta)-hydroxysteroid dehydrogenase